MAACIQPSDKKKVVTGHNCILRSLPKMVDLPTDFRVPNVVFGKGLKSDFHQDVNRRQAILQESCFQAYFRQSHYGYH